MRKFALLVLFALLPLALSCGDTDPTDPLKAGAPSDLVSDANQNDGNRAFFWLAPVVKNNVYSGVFNQQLKPWVVICELDTAQDPDVCNPAVDTLAQWTMSTGLHLSTADEHYGFEWHTDQTATNFEATYRIQVYLTESGETLLGYADVQFFSNGQELKNINTDETIELQDGRTLPGRFRIEKGASCNAEADCGEAIIGPDGGTVTTEAGFAGTELPTGAVDGDILIKIRRIDPSSQDWGRCLPTGLRQEEGCYEFDTEPAIGEVNAQDAFNTPVVVGVCINPLATRPEKLALHKYDPDKPANGVVELDASPETFLSCDGFAFQEEPSGLFGRFASAARRLLRPVASMIAVRELYATDEGRGGVTDSYSFIGWAEPVDLTVSSAPLAVLPATAVPATVYASTSHNHSETDPALDASGHTLRFDYADPAGQLAVLAAATTDLAGLATPVWTLTEAIGVHSITVTTQLQIVVDGEPFLVPDPTTPLVVTVGGYQTAEACEGETDCGQAIVDNDGATVTTENGFAGTDIPAGALDEPVLITIRRVDPKSQPWGDCLPTGLRQEEGCYEFDTEPALGEVNQQDAFNTNVTVAVCLDPQAVRGDRLTLHKFDPEKPTGGVVELAGAAETFLTCDAFAYDGDTGLLGRFARGARRLLSPVADMVIGTPLYATDEGRGGVTDSYSFIGWAEPVELTAADVPVAVLPSTAVPTTIQARTAHNHSEPIENASGHTLRIVYTDPTAAVSGLPAAVTDASGQASPSWTLTAAVGVHTLTVSTRMVVGGVEIPDPTGVLTVAVGGFTTADACDNDPDCGQAVVDEAGDTVTTSTGFAGTVIPPGALDGAVLVTIRRIDPDTQPWGDCLPTGLRQEEGCYEFDTEPALSEVQVDGEDKFNVNVEVAVCIDPFAVRSDRLTLHKFDPDKPAGGVVELAGAVGDFITCDGFAMIPNGFFERLAQAGRRLLGPIASQVAPRPLYAALTDEGRGGVTDSYSFIGWAEPVTLSLTTAPNAADASITDVVVSAETAHNHGLLPEPADGATLRFEHTDPSGNVTVTELPTVLLGSVAEARIPLTSQGGTHNVRVSTQEEIIIDSDLLIVSAGGGPGLFAAPRITLVGEPTEFLVPDPTVAVESGPLTVLGLVSRWDADDLANPFADRVGPNHGDTIGVVDGTAAGIDGNGFFFNGSGGEMVAPANHIGSAGRFTVAAWVKLDPAGSPFAIQRFVSIVGRNGAKAVLRQEAASTDLARQAHFYGSFGPDDGTGSSLVHIREPNALLEGCWQHVAGTYDGAQIAFYRDGALIHAEPVPAEDVDASVVAERVAFGAPGAEALHGTLDEVEVHNHALSATEVGALAGAFNPTCDVTTGSSAGGITNAATGEPLAGVSVSVVGTNLGTITDLNGRYRLRNVPAGTQTIRAQMIGYETAEQIVEVTAGSFVGVDFALTEAPADLQIANVTWSSSLAEPGSTHFLAELDNLGAGAAGPFQVAFAFRDWGTGELMNDSDAHPGMPAGDFDSADVHVPLPDGDWQTQVRVDAANEVAESDEENNLFVVNHVLLGTYQTYSAVFAGSAGGHQTCALDADGAAWCWGRNVHGQLGRTDAPLTCAEEPCDDRAGPVSGERLFRLLGVGANHVCGLLSDGAQIYCWGLNSDGQLGNGTTNQSTDPVLAQFEVSDGFVSVDAGADHSCAVSGITEVFCWGDNATAQIGDGTTVDRPTPVGNFIGSSAVRVATGHGFTCISDKMGTVYCWGRNDVGQSGSLSAETCTGSQIDCRITPAAITVNAETTPFLRFVEAGAAHGCALDLDGLAWCWGSNAEGQLGTETTETCTSAGIPCSRSAVLVPSGTVTFTTLSAGAFHTCGVTSTGETYCWGRASSGELGYGADVGGTTLRLVADPLSGVENGAPDPHSVTWSAVAGGARHTCGLSSLGTVYCWGASGFGQLGRDLSYGNQLNPARIYEARP